MLPFFVDADDAANPGGMPIGGVTRSTSQHHLLLGDWYGLGHPSGGSNGLVVANRTREAVGNTANGLR